MHRSPHSLLVLEIHIKITLYCNIILSPLKQIPTSSHQPWSHQNLLWRPSQNGQKKWYPWKFHHSSLFGLIPLSISPIWYISLALPSSMRQSITNEILPMIFVPNTCLYKTQFFQFRLLHPSTMVMPVNAGNSSTPKTMKAHLGEWFWMLVKMMGKPSKFFIFAFWKSPTQKKIPFCFYELFW